MTKSLYYIHDPMCSWCWGFRPVWQKIQQQLPQDLNVTYVLGGLAPDSDQTMPNHMQAYIQQTWKKIQQHIPETKFNFDFWRKCEPRRSTYPACRGVLAAKKQGAEFEWPMIEAIQNAYYLEALNPSNNDTLVEIAEKIGLDKTQFWQTLEAKKTQLMLEEDLSLCEHLFVQSGTSGFPSLMLQLDEQYLAVPRNYTEADIALDFIREKLGET
ncbi:MAG: putative protein-disulfide isomerase [Cellvibrionaceae bacterium]|jgi:putative protein-disulfide isomerase